MLFLLLLIISLIGCKQNSEVKDDTLQRNTARLEVVTIYPMDSSSETIVIDNTETIDMLKEAVSMGEKQPGIVNVADPEYKIEIDGEIYHLIKETPLADSNGHLFRYINKN